MKKKINITYLDIALNDLNQIIFYYKSNNISGLSNIINKLESKILILTKFPKIGVIYCKKERIIIRKIICFHYLIFYSYDKLKKQIVIHTIIHEKRNIIDILKDIF